MGYYNDGPEYDDGGPRQMELFDDQEQQAQLDDIKTASLVPDVDEKELTRKENLSKLCGTTVKKIRVKIPEWLRRSKGWPRVGDGWYVGEVLKVTEHAVKIRPINATVLPDWLPLSQIKIGGEK